MGLMNKLKNILFEEEEVEIPVLEKKEKKAPISREAPTYKEPPKSEPTYNNSFYDDLKPTIEKESRLEEEAKKSSPIPIREDANISDREMFRSDKTFNFPAFDEEEFESIKTPRNTNVMVHERKKMEKKNEYKRIEKKEETRGDTKFKPSPIISPVYGILDKNYTPEEITSRTPVNKRLDLDSVRKKAFGSPEKNEPTKTKDNEEVIIKDYQDYDDKILEEKLEKARTIDELLKDSSDDVITLREEKEETTEEVNLNTLDDIKEDEELSHDVLEDDAITSLDELTPKKDNNMEDDTLESDLFDLIDSMYENREDGE